MSEQENDPIAEGSDPVGEQLSPRLSAAEIASTRTAIAYYRGLQSLSEYQQTGSPESLSEALRLLGAAAQPIDPDSDDARHQRLCSFAWALRLQHEVHQDLQPLKTAARALSLARQVAPPHDPVRSEYSFDLGSVLLLLHKQTGADQYLADAIEALEAAVAEPADEHAVPADHLYALAGAHHESFRLYGRVVDLRACIARQKQALGAAAEVHPARRVQLAQYLAGEWRVTGDGSTLDAVVDEARSVIPVLEEGSDAFLVAAILLADHLNARYGVLGSVDDLEESIRHYEMLARFESASSD